MTHRSRQIKSIKHISSPTMCVKNKKILSRPLLFLLDTQDTSQRCEVLSMVLKYFAAVDVLNLHCKKKQATVKTFKVLLENWPGVLFFKDVVHVSLLMNYCKAKKQKTKLELYWSRELQRPCSSSQLNQRWWMRLMRYLTIIVRAIVLAQLCQLDMVVCSCSLFTLDRPL